MFAALQHSTCDKISSLKPECAGGLLISVFTALVLQHLTDIRDDRHCAAFGAQYSCVCNLGISCQLCIGGACAARCTQWHADGSRVNYRKECPVVHKLCACMLAAQSCCQFEIQQQSDDMHRCRVRLQRQDVDLSPQTFVEKGFEHKHPHKKHHTQPGGPGVHTHFRWTPRNIAAAVCIAIVRPRLVNQMKIMLLC
jgi:hypothetical protein